MDRRRLSIWFVSMVALGACSGQANAGLQVFTDRSAFESRLAPGFSIEDFEDNLASPDNFRLFLEPLDEFSDNTAFDPGEIVPGLNLRLSGPAQILAMVTEGFLGSPSAAVGPLRLLPDLILEIPGGTRALGFDYFALVAPGPAQIVIRDGFAPVESFPVEVSNTPSFFGVISEGEPFTTAAFRDIGTPVGELVDNVTFGEVVPEPSTLVAFGCFVLVAVVWSRGRSGSTRTARCTRPA